MWSNIHFKLCDKHYFNYIFIHIVRLPDYADSTAGADLGFFKRESKILGSDRCDVIVMTSPIR